MKLIRKFIGSWTLPEDVYVCSLGDYWIGVYFIPNEWGNLGFSGYSTRDYSHPHNYRKLEQDFWGVWKEGNTWLGLNKELGKLIK